MIKNKDYLKLIIRGLFILTGLLFYGCNSSQKSVRKKELFKPIVADFDDHGKLILPKGFRYEVLFSEGDSVLAGNGELVPAKGMHDCTIFIPIEGSNDHGHLYVSHEDIVKNEVLGHGGGATVMEVMREKEQWKIIGPKRNVDFSNVGGTLRNCGGKLTKSGMVLTAEEGYANSNVDLWSIFPDTSIFNGQDRYKNFGFIVEVDPVEGKAIRKLRSMGRYSHEDAYCLDDGKTVLLTEDESPAVLFKFVADQANDYGEGTLYAYKQTENGKSGDWIALPREENTIMNARAVALANGATLFNRHEWLTKVGDKVYITETGYDEMDWSWAIEAGGVPAYYFEEKYAGTTKGVFNDPYGRVLELDLKTNRIREYLAGGNGTEDEQTNFSSPDCITSVAINERDYIVINEDLIGLDKGRIKGKALKESYSINEIYFVDASIQNPTVDDLKRFLIGPKGCETTGGYFTPDGKTYFLSIQHPNSDNPAPFNKSCVIAITGF